MYLEINLSNSCTERTQYFHGTRQSWGLFQTPTTWENTRSLTPIAKLFLKTQLWFYLSVSFAVGSNASPPKPTYEILRFDHWRDVQTIMYQRPASKRATPSHSNNVGIIPSRGILYRSNTELLNCRFFHIVERGGGSNPCSKIYAADFV